MDVDFRLQDGDESLGDDLFADGELLLDDSLDALFVRLLDDGAHLRAKDMALYGAVEEGGESVDGLHELYAVLLGGESLVNLQNRHDAFLLPQVVCRIEVVDLAIHRVFEEDGRENLLFCERGAFDDARAHLMNAREHFLVVGIGALIDAVSLQRLRRRTAALVEGGDEALAAGHAIELLLIHFAYLLKSFPVLLYLYACRK